MKAVIAAPGAPLVVGEVPAPTVKDNEVLIEVVASGLNRADLMQRAGMYPPPPGASDILGLEVAGTVVETGPGTSQFKVGDRVCALLGGGGYAELATAHEGSCFPIPETMGFGPAACLPEAMMTVWANVFMRSRLTKGESFLMHGGTSGIGVFAIQMAKAAGASHIFATAGTEEKLDVCRRLGADTAINYRTEDFVEVVTAGGGADVIIDLVGGEYVQRNIEAANLNGRICNIAYQDNFETTVNFMPVLMKRLVLTATTLRARPNDQKQDIRDAVQKYFWPYLEAGAMQPVLDSTFAMVDAEAAHQRLEAGGHIGKIVLVRD